jgi:hypothetical protein
MFAYSSHTRTPTFTLTMQTCACSLRTYHSLVQKGATIPVPEGLLYRISNRYKRFGTKAPPSLVPVPYEPVLKAPPRGLPGECRLGTFGTGL